MCGVCRGVRGGPIGEVDGVEVLQLCACSTSEDSWGDPRVGDFNMAFELCRCCGLEALESGSRWSVWFCDPCKDKVSALNINAGRCLVPIGRHSLMNQVALEPHADEAVALSAFTGQLASMVEKIGDAEKWSAAAVRLNLSEAGLPTNQDIDLDTYLAAVRPLEAEKAHRFTQMVNWLFPTSTGEGQPEADT